MEKVLQLLNELMIVQRNLVAVSRLLIAALEQEEKIASDGFSLQELQVAIASKDQIIHRFAATETKRRQMVSKLAFFIGLDTRNLVPTLSMVSQALLVYSRNLTQVLNGEDLTRCQDVIHAFCVETESQLPEFEMVARRIQRNKVIVSRVLGYVNKSVRFFEQAFKVTDIGYDKGGKITSHFRKSRDSSQVKVKA